MTTEAKKRYLERRDQLDANIRALERAKIDVAASGTASATLSSGSGSKSYTHLDLDSITRLENDFKRERAWVLRQLLCAPVLRRIMITR